MKQQAKSEKNKYKELEEEIHYLRRMNKELLDSQFQQDSLDFAWSGNLGHSLSI